MRSACRPATARPPAQQPGSATAAAADNGTAAAARRAARPHLHGALVVPDAEKGQLPHDSAGHDAPSHRHGRRLLLLPSLQARILLLQVRRVVRAVVAVGVRLLAGAAQLLGLAGGTAGDVSMRSPPQNQRGGALGRGCPMPGGAAVAAGSGAMHAQPACAVPLAGPACPPAAPPSQCAGLGCPLQTTCSAAAASAACRRPCRCRPRRPCPCLPCCCLRPPQPGCLLPRPCMTKGWARRVRPARRIAWSDIRQCWVRRLPGGWIRHSAGKPLTLWTLLRSTTVRRRPCPADRSSPAACWTRPA